MPEIVLAVPPDRTTGMPPDATLAAAAIAGVDEVYRIGGAQAIAALAYGTESVVPVDVIAGPATSTWPSPSAWWRGGPGRGAVGLRRPQRGRGRGRRQRARGSPPSDVVVQAEHGPGGLAWLVTWDEAVLDAVTTEVARIAASPPRRPDRWCTALRPPRR